MARYEQGKAIQKLYNVERENIQIAVCISVDFFQIFPKYDIKINSS